METKMNLYLITVMRMNTFYVLASHPTEAQEKLGSLLDKANWWYSNDRKVKMIELIAEEIKYFPQDHPSFKSNGYDLIK